MLNPIAEVCIPVLYRVAVPAKCIVFALVLVYVHVYVADVVSLLRVIVSPTTSVVVLLNTPPVPHTTVNVPAAVNEKLNDDKDVVVTANFDSIYCAVHVVGSVIVNVRDSLTILSPHNHPRNILPVGTVHTLVLVVTDAPTA